MSRKELAETSRMPEAFNTAPEESDGVISLDSAEESTEDSEPESDGNESLELLEKKVSATTLFEEQKDVAGAHVFGFRTPKKRDSMAVLASASAQRTPQQSAMPKTPSHTRRLKKKALAKMIRESDSDFSMSESDFEPSGDEEDESSSSDADDDEAEHERRPSVRTPARGSARKSIQPGPTSRDSSHRSKELAVRRPKADGKRKPVTEYIVQSDLYFSTHSRANPTSDRTLDRLPRLQEADVHTLLMENPATNHSAALQELIDSCEDSFSKWMGIMDAGFNILLYGLGSKLRVMQLFQQQELKQMPVLVLNGFFPGLALKEILDSIAINLLDLRLPTSNPHEIVDAIERELSFTPKQHIFLLVHNLDGAGLRNIRTQNVLCHLASIPNIHLLATIDSINAPMMWDTTQLNNFNFYWQDVSTLAPYHVETSFEQSLLVYNAGAPALSSMHSVFSSLTSNGRGVYLAIVRHQLANGGPTNPNYNGMLFKDLYWICREAFLVSSDQALRTQLVEFIDHKMLRGKRTADGAENLIIPVDHDLLQRFFDALPDDQK
ncbi:origin recognition complex subunit 2 [Anopheles ziemanni]|uniref:origin recognition complex subunit 2 n=1 Tax=Anopheles ziemanni TaxID=345580 RepID=UPI00265E8BBF|nr:origin recognition complex subunit 2 [Anopheles ziemanni]